MSHKATDNDTGFIPVDQEKFELLNSLAHGDSSLLREIVDTYSKQEEKYLDGYRAFIYGLLQPLGIIAGFGFTAIGSVKTLWLFVLGEAMLIGAIIFAASRVRKAYTSTLDGLAKAKEDNIALVWERIEFSSGLLDQALTKGAIPADIHLRQSALNKKLMNAHKPTKKDDRYYKFKDHIPVTFVLTAIGITLVLLSLLSIEINYCGFFKS